MLGLSSAWLVLLALVLAWDAWRMAAGMRRQQALSDPAQRHAAQSSMPLVVPSLRAALEQQEHPRRLTDDQIGAIWFAARIPGLTESDARRLIRAAEEAR
jgi:hypothetical protein